VAVLKRQGESQASVLQSDTYECNSEEIDKLRVNSTATRDAVGPACRGEQQKWLLITDYRWNCTIGVCCVPRFLDSCCIVDVTASAERL
jgi:hypothetical protein